MKKILILSCLLFLINACTKRGDGNCDFGQKIYLSKIGLNDEVNNFVSGFMKSIESPECIYELYIDKKTEDEYVLTLRNLPSDTNYFSNHFPLNYSIIEDKMVFIYSGIEDFVNREKYYSGFSIKEEREENRFSYESVSKIINRDTSFCVDVLHPPFTDVIICSTIYFKPPPEEDDKK